jgi:hypothetical protein
MGEHMMDVTRAVRARRIAFCTLLLIGSMASGPALACASCGCTLSSDWGSQGYAGQPGFRMDLRYDYFNQDQLREGSRSVDRAALDVPNDREIQQLTINRIATLALDYSPNADWGFTLTAPYIDRYHTTLAPGDTDVSTSHTRSMGDVKLLARYSGLSADRGLGVQAGVKLATGSFHNAFIDGPQAGEPLDRGLQPGTGTTDLIVGLYGFGELNPKWEYFGQALVNFGVRYTGMEKVFPQVQVNVRGERRESGANADVENSGSTLAYLSPGVMVKLSNDLVGYAFVQAPIYQRVNGFQIEPRYSISVGLHYSL